MDDIKSDHNLRNCLDSQNIPQINFSQMEEIYTEYHKNKQIVIEEMMDGMNEVFSELGNLNEDLGKAMVKEEKRKENLLLLKNSSCKITKEFYDTIKFHFNTPFFKKT